MMDEPTFGDITLNYLSDIENLYQTMKMMNLVWCRIVIELMTERSMKRTSSTRAESSANVKKLKKVEFSKVTARI